MITKDSSEEEILAEIDKCYNDPYYMFITYWKDKEGNSPNVSREYFEAIYNYGSHDSKKA